MIQPTQRSNILVQNLNYELSRELKVFPFYVEKIKMMREIRKFNEIIMQQKMRMKVYKYNSRKCISSLYRDFFNSKHKINK